MTPAPRSLGFAWWNAHDFAHFTRQRASERRWPLTPHDYEAKSERVVRALRELFAADVPDLFGLCEVTQPAAEALQASVFPAYDLHLIQDLSPDSKFQVVVFAKRGVGLADLLPLVTDRMTETTRPMLRVEHAGPTHRVLFVFCHWTAFDAERSDVARERLAAAVSDEAYRYTHPGGVLDPARHVVIIGDLNAEPFDPLFSKYLHASRDRRSAQGREHPADRAVRRVRFYNAAWRFLGESRPHERPATTPSVCGTFHAPAHGWRAFDHVLVTGGLLGPEPPYLDESALGIITGTTVCGPDGRPRPFDPDRPAVPGVSDHLPIAGRIRLPEEPTR